MPSQKIVQLLEDSLIPSFLSVFASLREIVSLGSDVVWCPFGAFPEIILSAMLGGRFLCNGSPFSVVRIGMCPLRLAAFWRLGLFAPAVVSLFPGVLKAQDANSSDKIPINHFIYIIQENHSFDNYFGTYPKADGIKPGTKLAEKPGGPRIYKPFHLSGNAIPQDLSHSWQAAHTAYNHGRMDGFVWAEWPAALAYYWRAKPVPTPDPEDIQDMPTPTPAGTPPSQPPPPPPPSWVLNTLSYMDYTQIPN